MGKQSGFTDIIYVGPVATSLFPDDKFALANDCLINMGCNIKHYIYMGLHEFKGSKSIGGFESKIGMSVQHDMANNFYKKFISPENNLTFNLKLLL